jgi:membrane fusion protein (multidrug efflux system)
MAETLDTNREPEGPDADAEKKGERAPGAGKRDQKETSVVVDENARPLSADDDGNGHQHFKKRPVYKRPAYLIGAIIVVLIVAIFGIRYWLYARSHETTDDAFIDGHIIQVSSKASGYVAKLHVTDNQQVNAGDLLAELDARDYEAKVAQAKAALDAGLAQHHQAQTQVILTRANTNSNVQQAAAGVRQARSGVTGAQSNAAAERSRISQAAAGVSNALANVDQSRAQLTAALAQAARANADVRRYQELYSKDEISRQQLDVAVAAARTADAQVEAARQKVAASEAQVNEARAAESAQSHTAKRAQTQITGAEAQVSEAQGRLAEANTAPQQVAVSEAQARTAGANLESLRAALDAAELELSYTKIYAPEAGRVTRKAVEVGALVQVGQPLMAVVPGEVWVTANFKESQIGSIRPGQSAEVTVDAYSDKTFRGHVDSIQAGTGARFSLLPAENATGSYVKVVQRIPVKIVFDEPIDPRHLLAPGMSVVPQVKVK